MTLSSLNPLSSNRTPSHPKITDLPYTWKQTLTDVDVVIPVQPGTRSKDLEIIIKNKRIKVSYKGKEPILEGELAQNVVTDDCTWTLDSQREVNIHLEKMNRMEWWKNVVTHHPEIDTSKIEPENSKLSDLDGETRSMVTLVVNWVWGLTTMFTHPTTF